MSVPTAMLRARSVCLLTAQSALVAVSLASAFALHEGTLGSRYFWAGLPIVLSVKLAMAALAGLHRGIWRYAGIRDLMATARWTGASSLLLVIMVLAAGLPLGLLAVAVIDGLLSFVLFVTARVAPRVLREFAPSAADVRSLVVVGAGDAGEAVVRELVARSAGYVPVAFVDDDPRKRGMSIHGVPVQGRTSDLAAIVERHDADAVLVAMCGVGAQRKREILEIARATGRPVKRIPSRDEMLGSGAAIGDLRDLTLEDLLPRRPVRTDREPVTGLLTGRTVLVTGAAGSIGSELARQVVAHRPARLLMLDSNENALFELEHEMRARSAGVHCVPLLCSVQDKDRLDRIFRQYRPEVVFHAAAYKHVPVLEHFPEEAVRNNVKGTRCVAELAHAYGADRFVLISTDKAVRPTSVMGTTKRVAEMVVREIDRRSDTRFRVIRFGNVLGSNGSVLQLFRRQIAEGGPVTVTHPEIRRFFMSIPEAVELVLFAAALEGEGRTFILDMGKQVRIYDLARHFIRMCGLEPERDIPIEFVGLRPGEKLYEELWTEAEVPVATEHPSILCAPLADDELLGLPQRVQSLIDWAEEGNREQLVAHLRALVPDYNGTPVGMEPPPVNGSAIEAVAHLVARERDLAENEPSLATA